MKKESIKAYAYSVGIALATGGLSALLSSGAMKIYNGAVEKPAFSPPAAVFPVVWSVLFVLMGISAARIFLAPGSLNRTRGLLLYGLQLFLNFFWTLIFFNLQAFGFAFAWLVLLWATVLVMISVFYKTDRAAAFLQLPYLLWLSFAGVLNFAVWRLNG